MLNISQNTADSIFNFSNIFLVVGTTIVLIATIGVIFSSSIREKYSNERISLNEKLASVAKADAAKAIENAATSNLRAAEVEKQNIILRMKFSNRRVNKKQYLILIQELSKNPSTFNMETMGDPESGLYAADILKTFLDSGWKIDRKEFPLGIIWTGIILFQTNDPAAVYIADALIKAKIKFLIGDQFREKATIMIGGKPPVF